MFQLDDNFLMEIGLDQLPREQRKDLLQHIYSELELQVGTKLSDGMSDAQLEEFEAIIDKKEDVITKWISQHAPDYQNDENFVRMQQTMQLDPDNVDLRNEYAATKWLEVNRPDYRDVVAEVLEKIKNEVKNNRDAILGEAES